MLKYLYNKKEISKADWFKKLQNTARNFSSLRRILKIIRKQGYYRTWSVNHDDEWTFCNVCMDYFLNDEKCECEE